MNSHVHSKNSEVGNSLVVQWLGLGTFTARAQVRSLVRELKSCKPCSAAKKKKKKKKFRGHFAEEEGESGNGGSWQALPIYS